MPVTGQTNPELFPLYYEKKVLEYMKENLVALRFAQRFRLPRNSGRTAVWTRFQPIPKATNPITDQPTPSTGASMTTQQVQATIEEYGNYIDLDEFTDITSFTPLMDRATDLLSYNAQQSLDAVAMNEITSGTNVIYAGGVTQRLDLAGKPITKTEIRKAVNLLQRNNIPPFPDGYYVCLIHPDKTLDLFTDQELIQLSFTKKEAIEKGFIGEFAGVKFIVSTTLPIVPNGNTTTPDDVYLTAVLGQNAYGVVDLDRTTFRMEYTNLDKLGRVKTIGWKAYFAVKRLYEPAIVRIESN